jgi:hypothetical protein
VIIALVLPGAPAVERRLVRDIARTIVGVPDIARAPIFR